jgi:hypothetical protein
MENLARQINRELKSRRQSHCAIYEHELQLLWPLEQKDREAKIAQFAAEYGFRLRHYSKGLCAIFDRQPVRRGP